MGRRPTIQTTVTASLTKSSLGACNQMLPVKFASTFFVYRVFVSFKSVKKQKKSGKVPPETTMHLDGASIIHLSPLSSDAIVSCHRRADRCGHHLSSQSG